MNAQNYIKLEFPSKSSNESFARMAAAAFAAQLDPTLEELGDIKTAVSEAVTNCIVHAYPESVGKIRLRMRILDSGELEIVVQDWGKGMKTCRRPESRSILPVARSAAVWALPSWRALRTSFGCAPARDGGPR